MNAEKLITIGIADDHDITRNEMTRILEQLGFKVIVTAQNGKDLMEKLRTSSFLPNVCLLDIDMPIMNGFETAIELSTFYPRIKILANSINDSEDYVIKMFQNGACGYFIKGQSIIALKSAIDSCHNNGHYFNKNTAKAVLQFLMKNK